SGLEIAASVAGDDDRKVVEAVLRSGRHRIGPQEEGVVQERSVRSGVLRPLVQYGGEGAHADPIDLGVPLHCLWNRRAGGAIALYSVTHPVEALYRHAIDIVACLVGTVAGLESRDSIGIAGERQRCELRL